MRKNRVSGGVAALSKRAFDVAVAGTLIVLAFPVLLVLTILVRWLLGGPVLFCQQRPGMNEKLFTMYKLRTMTDARDEQGNLLPDEVRLTPFGRFLRMSSLDELPELFNVLLGDMSLVGPRPLMPEYLPYYSDGERIRHRVRPGVTGWAQVNGRNFIPWDSKLRLDAWYVDNWSFALDLKILVLTAVKVLQREGVAANASVVEGRLDHKRGGQGAVAEHAAE